jgi:hypothetical protein
MRSLKLNFGNAIIILRTQAESTDIRAKVTGKYYIIQREKDQPPAFTTTPDLPQDVQGFIIRMVIHYFALRK